MTGESGKNRGIGFQYEWKSLIKFHVIIIVHCTKQSLQGIDGSASKPTLIQDTGYMVEKTYPDIAPYLVAFGAYLMPQY